MKRFSLAGLVGTGLIVAGFAQAADLGTRPVYKAPPIVAPVPLFSWTGCYIGGHIGGAWGQKTFSDATVDTFLIDDTDSTRSVRIGGGQVGCDYQFAPNWVIGIEGNLSGADITGSAINPFDDDGNMNLSVKTDWLGSVTPRLGFTIGDPRFLLFVKGGPAWARDRYQIADDDVNGSISETRSGWTIGGGIEWAFAPSWSVRIEYAFYDFGTKTLDFCSSQTAPPLGALLLAVQGCHVNIQQEIQAITVGLNYRFGWGKTPTPVVAKY
jgi:outer membrane immunogenic protein